MKDGIIKGQGNSRYLKSVADFLTRYPDYESFSEALMTGTLPIDLNGINADGWTQTGTPLNTASLLADATASALGLPNTATPNDAVSALATKAAAALPKSGGAMTGTLANANAAQVRNIQAGTDDLTAGTSSLTTGTVYLVYE